MGSILEPPHYPPARTPSKTSRAFRSDQNTFSPFGSLAELNAATTQPMHPPSNHGQGSITHRQSPSNNLPPPEEVADDLAESFYGEETDYGNVTRQMHPHDEEMDFLMQGNPSPYYRGSRVPSRAGTGWGSRAGSSYQNTPHAPGQVYSLRDDQFIPPPMSEKWPGSRAGTDLDRGHHDEHQHQQVHHIPSIQIHPEDREDLYPPVQHARTKSSRATVRHVTSDDGRSEIIRTKSSRAAIQHPDYSGSSDHGNYDNHQPPYPPVARTKSSRASVHRTPRDRTSSRGSRPSARDLALTGAIPSHFVLDGDNAILQVHLPWTERLNHRPCRFHVTGIDGNVYMLEVDYQWTKMVQGKAKFRGAGLPRQGGRGRGTLVVAWEIWFEEDPEEDE